MHQEASYIHKSWKKMHCYMHHTFRIRDQNHRCIMHTYTLQDQGPGSLLCASYTHVSGSSIVDKCIIHMCIMATCIRINNVCIIHTNIRVKDHTFMHATGSRIMDMCMDIYIIHCKSYTHASGSRILITCMQRIIIIDICIIHTCIIITCVRIKGICIMHTCTRIEDHIYIHASYIYQGQGLMICIIHACIIDTCIIRACASYIHVSGPWFGVKGS